MNRSSTTHIALPPQRCLGSRQPFRTAPRMMRECIHGGTTRLPHEANSARSVMLAVGCLASVPKYCTPLARAPFPPALRRRLLALLDFHPNPKLLRFLRFLNDQRQKNTALKFANPEDEIVSRHRSHARYSHPELRTVDYYSRYRCVRNRACIAMPHDTRSVLGR